MLNSLSLSLQHTSLLYLSPSLSVSLCPCLCPCLSLSFCLCPSICLSVYLSLHPTLLLSLSLHSSIHFLSPTSLILSIRSIQSSTRYCSFDQQYEQTKLQPVIVAVCSKRPPKAYSMLLVLLVAIWCES